jgi:UDP-N-acetylglucosamine 2-epimerase (non-hydrolysing)
MKSKRVLTVIGTRPEAIKMAPVLEALSQEPQFESVLCGTGQHADLFQDALAAFQLKSDIDLAIMTDRQSLDELASRCMARLAPVVRDLRPDVVLVHGDTTTTLSAAMVAFYERVPIGHVEAGLRSGDLRNPFPEEMNRIVVDRIADHCFAPTPANRANLLKEGIPAERILVTGNTAVDAVLEMHRRVSVPERARRIQRSTGFPRAAVETGMPIILVTAHRRESFGTGIRSVCDAIAMLAQRHPDWQFVYPVHPNPNVEGVVRPLLSGLANVHLPAPLNYEQFVMLMGRARLILTDSGGIQEEAPSLGTPVVLLRAVTERNEAVEAGHVVVAGLGTDGIATVTEQMMLDPAPRRAVAGAANPYGDGNAARRIVEHLRRVL